MERVDSSINPFLHMGVRMNRVHVAVRQFEESFLERARHTFVLVVSEKAK
jgi:hypothetical protein